MTACRSRIELKSPDLRRYFVSSAKNPSTLLSHEHEANVYSKNASAAVTPLSFRCIPVFALPANTRTKSHSMTGDGLDRRRLPAEGCGPQHFTLEDSAAQSGAEVLG